MKKRLVILCATAICILAAAVWLFSPKAAPVPPRAEPAGLDQTSVTARWLPEEHILAVTQEMTIRNRTGERWPDIMLHLPANRCRTEALSPAASEERAQICYPDGFSPGFMTLEHVSAGGQALSPQWTDESETCCLVPASLMPDEQITLRLRYLLSVPQCRYFFGEDESAVRLCRVFPALCSWENHCWAEPACASVGDDWRAPLTRYTFSLELPDPYLLAAGCTVSRNGNRLEGALTADDLCLVLFKDSPRQLSRTEGSVTLNFLSSDPSMLSPAAELFSPFLSALSRLYGPPAPETVCVCAVPGINASFPGLILISPDASALPSPAQAAYLSAGQWFSAGFSLDRFREGWMADALSEWAGEQALLKARGAAAQEEQKRTFVDAAMRENVHLPLTPGSPLSSYPDEDTVRTLRRGRGCAFLIAADTLCGGRMNEFLRVLLAEHRYSVLSEEKFLKALNGYFGMDFAPLLTDYIHTVIAP